MEGGWEETYSLCDVVYDHRAVRVPVVHRCEGFVSLLPCCVPYFEFDGCLLVEGDGLSEEGGADGRFSVVVELVLISVLVGVMLGGSIYLW